MQGHDGQNRIRGVIGAAAAPLGSDGAMAAGVSIDHCRWLLANGCDGVLLHGTTGEANSFTVDERLAVLDTVAAALPANRLLVGTGCCALPDTIRLTRRALDLGVAGVVMLPPFYYKNLSEDGLYAAFARVIETTGSAGLRLYIYHFPQLTGIPFPIAVMERLVADFPGTVAGIKDSSGDLDHMLALCAQLDGFDVFSGTEKYLLPVLRAGGAGCISASANVTCGLAGALYRGWQSAEADSLQDRLTEIRTVFDGYPLAAAVKSVLARNTGRPEWQRLRPPLIPLDADAATALEAQLAALEFTLPTGAAVPASAA